MKKVLLIGGIGLAGFGLYRYFNYQVKEALNYDYNVKNFQILSIEGNNVNISVEFDITNKSNFEILVNSYDLDFYYKNQKIGNTASSVPVTVLPSTKFTVKATGVINTNAIKESALSLAKDVINRKPISIEIKGNIKVKFLGIKSTVTFDKESFQYSADLLKSSGFDTALHNFGVNNPKIGSILGIK